MSSGIGWSTDDEAGLASEVFVDDADRSPLDDGYALVGAVHHLTSAARIASKSDLLLAAACHALKGGPKTLDEVVIVVERVWPGAKVDSDSVGAALEMGVELRQVQKSEGLEHVALWELTADGLRDIHDQEKWVAHIRSTAVDDLRRMARSGLATEVSSQKAELWLDVVVRALIVGITSTQDAHLGRVRHLVGKRLAPQGIDQMKVLRELESVPSDPATIEFLKTVALSALDPLEPFASELVHSITTGCVLHSYVAGRDSAALIDQVGLPVNQRAVLDTPVLLDLIGPNRVSRAVEHSIRTAVASGWDVVVARHTIEELQILVEHEVPDLVRRFQNAHNHGVREEWVASLAADQLPAYWVEAHREGKYRKADDMVQAAATVESLLEDLNVHVRYHFNENDGPKVAQFATALRDDLVGARPRTETVVERDADTMTMVWRRRKREPRGSKWPGGWVITPDRHMKQAYARVERRDTIPVTLTLSQWSTLCSVVVPPADVLALADAAATQLVEEAMWLLPSRFPSETAFELARQLSPERGGSLTDLRVAQLTLDGELERGAGRTPISMAAEVLALRASRVNALADQVVADAKLKEQSARLAVQTATVRVSETEKRLAKEQEALRQTKLSQAELAARIDWRERQLKRVVISFGVALVGMGAGFFVFFHSPDFLPRAAAVAGFVALAYALIVWCRKETSRIVWAFIGAIIQILGVASSAIGLLADLGALTRQ